MPVLLKDYRVNDFSGRRTVYSKLKRITDTGFDTSNDLFAEGNFSRLQGLNDNSKDYFSLVCNDIIKFGDLYVACGQNAYSDQRTGLSTFLYSEDDGVSWTFGNGTFESGGYGLVLIVSKDNNNINTLFCGGSGTDSNGNLYGLMSSTDGKTWTNVTTAASFSRITSMATNRSGKIVAFGSQLLQYSEDNGETWDTVSFLINPIDDNDNVKILYANDRFYIGITDGNSGVLTVHTASDLTNWTQVTFDNNNTTYGYLTGVYKNSVDPTYILYLQASNTSTIQSPVYYSDDGSAFTGSTGIDNINGVTNVTQDDYTGLFYLSVEYPADSPSGQNDPLIYSSPQGHAWQGYFYSTQLSSSLRNSSGDVTGISQFFIQDSAIVACVNYENTTNESFGLVYISLSNYTVSSYSTPIVLNDDGDYVAKLFHDGTNATLVGIYHSSIAYNTIYYVAQGQLVATEHNEDVG